MVRKKITVVGAGHVGATVALAAVSRELGDVVLVDINTGFAKGKALDLSETAPLLGSDVRLVGSKDYKSTKNSDIVVITAGVPRKQGMSRDDLIEINAKIIKSIIQPVKKYSPRCILIIVSNPLDAMVYLAKKLSKFPKNRIMGMAGVLDTTRYKSFIANELNVSIEDVHGLVLGGHGDNMVPLTRLTNISGIPLTELMSKEKIDEIVDRTRKGGGEFLPLLYTSAWIAPGFAVAEMLEAILHDKKRVLPCAVELHGEYGQENLFIGVPAVLGCKGVEKILEVKLNAKEESAFKKTAKHVRELTSIVDEIISKI